MKTKAFYLMITTMVVSLLFTACDNIRENEIDELALNDLEIELAEDDAMADEVFNTLDAMVEDEIYQLEEDGYTTLMLKSTDEETDPFVCKVVTVDHPDSTYFPKVITIDYGEEGCTVEIKGEQFTRKGKIVITITDRWMNEGAVRTTEYVNFYLNNMKVEGSRVVTNLGLNANNNYEFSHKLNIGRIINDTLIYTREGEWTREMVRGLTHAQNMWYVTGGSEGTTCDGYSYTSQIRERLMMVRCSEFRYQWTIVEGVVERNRANGANGTTAEIDYGTGACDGTATLTVNGEKTEIQTRNRFHNRRKLFNSDN